MRVSKMTTPRRTIVRFVAPRGIELSMVIEFPSKTGYSVRVEDLPLRVQGLCSLRDGKTFRDLRFFLQMRMRYA